MKCVKWKENLPLLTFNEDFLTVDKENLFLCQKLIKAPTRFLPERKYKLLFFFNAYFFYILTSVKEYSFIGHIKRD